MFYTADSLRRMHQAEKPWIFSSFMDISSLLMGAQPKAA